MRYAFLILLLPSAALGQFAPGSPFQRRMLRDNAVSHAGVYCRPFIETMGDPAARACLACTPQCAVQLAAFYYTRGFFYMPRPLAILDCIGQHGDGTAYYVMWHGRELEDEAASTAFLRNTLEYVLNLKTLEAGASDVRAERAVDSMSIPALPEPEAPELQQVSHVQATRFTLQYKQWNPRTIALFAGLSAIAALMMWRRKRNGQSVI